MTGRHFFIFKMTALNQIVLLLCLFCFGMPHGRAAESACAQNSPVSSPITNALPRFNVRTYIVAGSPLLPADTLASLFSQYTGTNITLGEIVKAASALQSEYHSQGCPAVSVAFVPEQIAGGVVTFNVAQTAISQIVVAGERCLSLSNGVEIISQPPVASVTDTNAAPSGTTNVVPPAINFAATRANQVEMANAIAAMHLKMAELEIQTKDTRVHVVSTNAGPRFSVNKYLIDGNTVLPPAAIGLAITNIDGAFGTNVSFAGIETVVTELGKAYKDRGYGTVKVDVPQQKLTNAAVKLQVLEGRLADIKVSGNRYFSSNNVMRALPSLHTNMVLNVPIFNAELNRANANQDRQIYPVIGPGPGLGASELTLTVKDRPPLHAKLELNNQASPDTPDLRLNSSAVYDNLWQAGHSLGVQYSFSPVFYKQGDGWNFYDAPMIVNYSAFYRMPLGRQKSIENVIANSPGSFGYDEATRKFNLPPPTGRPDLTLFASRSAIDTGLATTHSGQVSTNGSNPVISEQDVENSPTKNEDLGAHLNLPLPPSGNFQSSFSGGLDFKTYAITSYKTNNFLFTQTNYDLNNVPLPPITYTVPSQVPTTASRIEYLPLSLRYDGNWHDSMGTMSFGLGVTFNVWYDSSYETSLTLASPTYSTNAGVITTNTVTTTTTTSSQGRAAVTNITSSTRSSGHWVVINPSFSRDFIIDNWTTLFSADGQWASEPLISPEQFGAGGVNSVRGYHEGEVFGDTGWHLSLEEQTPPHVVGTVYDGAPLTIRGSVYMDFAKVYLIDPPPGSRASTPLWGTGFGLNASVGSHWQAQLLFSWPLLSAGTTTAYEPFFNFALTAQF